MSPMLTKFLLALSLGIASLAHMEQLEPAPIRSKSNPHIVTDSDIDYTMKEPLTNATFPYKGFHTLLGTPQGQPVATWAAGSRQSVTIGTQGGGQRMGGSCQISLSVDGGQTFTVLHSYIGNCVVPDAEETVLDFRIPSDAPASDAALLSWSWMNKSGIREYYQNCAAIVITEGGEEEEVVSFDKRPPLFVANLGNGCTTAEMADVFIPNPGPDVDIANPDAVPPIGECGMSAAVPAPPVDVEAPATPTSTPASTPSDGSRNVTVPDLENDRMSCICACEMKPGFK